MFTGIVEEVGHVRSLRLGAASAEIEIAARRVLEGTAVGDSILTDGVCLTVTALGGDGFRADAMPETVRRTTLAGLRPAAGVNLERALLAGSRLGGHLVTGHVDGVGTVAAVRREEIARWLEVEAPADVARLCVPRGSVTISGVSLTVVDVATSTVRVSLIPHTAQVTTLGSLRPGDAVNLEVDMLARYVDHFLHHCAEETFATDAPQQGSGLTWESLAGSGFE